MLQGSPRHLTFRAFGPLRRRMRALQTACVTIVAALGYAHALHATPTGNLTELASGFIWAENIWFDGLGGMYVSEFARGEVYKLTRPSFDGPVTKQLWLSGFTHVLGINEVWGSAGLMYAVVRFTDSCPGSSNTSTGIVIFNASTPQTYEALACTAPDQIGNGLAVNTRNGFGTLYSPSEGDFVPGRGLVYAVDPAARSVTEAVTGLFSADGAFLDQSTQLLYVSEVALGNIRIYNVSHDGSYLLVSSYHAPGCEMVDDFCVLYKNASAAPTSSPHMFSADYAKGSVVSFAADGSGEPTILATGLLSPTSVRSGSGPGWDNPSSLFVSEGGGYTEADAKRRVWELHLA